jgi:hypothetical protein
VNQYFEIVFLFSQMIIYVYLDSRAAFQKYSFFVRIRTNIAVDCLRYDRMQCRDLAVLPPSGDWMSLNRQIVLSCFVQFYNQPVSSRKKLRARMRIFVSHFLLVQHSIHNYIKQFLHITLFITNTKEFLENFVIIISINRK